MARYRSRNYHRSIGSERARAHIEAARRLSSELGGVDQDVKDYFFSLQPEQLELVLVEYGNKFGAAAKEYAEKTISKWRSRRVQMSGEVASRLFALLPPRMPLETKYKLVENLWKHVGPSSRKTISVTVDTPVDEIIEQAALNIREVVTNYKIHDNLTKRFEWLSSGDAVTKQQLLSHFQTMEKELTIEALSAQLPVLLEHLKSSRGINTRKLAQIATIGKHEVEIVLKRESWGRFAGPIRTPRNVKPDQVPWLGWGILAVVFGVFFIASIPHGIAPATQPQIANPITPITRNPTSSAPTPTQSANLLASEAPNQSLSGSGNATIARSAPPDVAAQVEQMGNQQKSSQPPSTVGEPLDLLDHSNAAQVQERLKALGYFASVPNGIWGPRSRSALRDFRRKNGLGVDDRWDVDTQAALLSENAIPAHDGRTSGGPLSKKPRQ